MHLLQVIATSRRQLDAAVGEVKAQAATAAADRAQAIQEEEDHHHPLEDQACLCRKDIFLSKDRWDRRDHPARQEEEEELVTIQMLPLPLTVRRCRWST
jgi:hypothetical protein